MLSKPYFTNNQTISHYHAQYHINSNFLISRFLIPQPKTMIKVYVIVKEHLTNTN